MQYYVGADLLSCICGLKMVQVASYEFTTLTCVPGVIKYRGSKIQVSFIWRKFGARVITICLFQSVYRDATNVKVIYCILL